MQGNRLLIKKRLQILVNAGTVCDSGIDIDMLYFMHFSGDWKINNLNAIFVSFNASCPHFWGRLQFLGFCQFWGNLNFLGFLPFYGHFSFVIVFILGVVYLIIHKYCQAKPSQAPAPAQLAGFS